MGTRPVEDIVAILLSFVIAVTIHEFMHAWVAHRFGDNTARDLGRITFNPVAHFEPIGFIGMVLIAVGFPFIGWGKPVPVQPGQFRGRWGRHRHMGLTFVAAAGPLSNIAQAVIVAIPFQIAVRNDIDLGQIGFFMGWFIQINILLAAFNAIPIPPLDGHKILMGILPSFWRSALAPLEQYGFVVLFMLLFVGGRGENSLVGGMINPVSKTLFNLLFTGLI